MKSRSYSTNKAVKQMFEIKTLWRLDYISLKTIYNLSLLRLRYKPARKQFKNGEAQKPKYVYKKNTFRSLNARL